MDMKEKAAEVEKLRKTGVSMEEAIKQVGINKSSYYSLRPKGIKPKRAYHKKRKSPEMVTLQVPHEETSEKKLICLIGDGASIAEAIKGLI